MYRRRRIVALMLLTAIIAITITGCASTSSSYVSYEPQPVQYSYAASSNSNVFHYTSCRYVSNINPNNLILFSSREQAIYSGRRPCKVCRP